VLEFAPMGSYVRVPQLERPIPSDWRTLASYIDHTMLRPEATRDEITQLCREAAFYGFAAVCVHTSHVALAWSLLRMTPVKVATVIGFPQGATLTTAKRFEAQEAVRLGADELDMVLNIGALKSGDRGLVEADIRGVADVAHQAGAILKVILETALLSDAEKVLGCELAIAAGAEFVKTSTGFSGKGATLEDVALMRRTVGDRAGVKASGGIRTAEDALAMIAAGADRLGTSSSVAIMRELGAPEMPKS
jgi:deoxyribose-phosphate aldolase